MFHSKRRLEDNAPYDLVCLDIMMPNMNGVEALEAIRNAEERFGVDRSRRCKIIMTTALNEVNQVEQAFELGCEGYAVKPIDTDKFLVILKKMGFDKMIIACLVGNPTNEFYKHIGGKLIKKRIFKKLNLLENVYYFESI